jgi:hypothetical protein
MSDTEDQGQEEDLLVRLRARAESLERQLDAARVETSARLVRAELKVEAIRAGMVDLDGLKLVDLSAVSVDEDGDVQGAGPVMERLKRDKPWLFGGASSSSRAAPPQAAPPKPKLATEMTDTEYRVARAELIRRRL